VQQRPFSLGFTLLMVVRFLNPFHAAHKVDQITASIVQCCIALTVTETVEGIFCERDMKLALVGTLMNWARANQLIAFAGELLLKPVVFENLFHRHRRSDRFYIYPLCHKCILLSLRLHPYLS